MALTCEELREIDARRSLEDLDTLIEYARETLPGFSDYAAQWPTYANSVSADAAANDDSDQSEDSDSDGSMSQSDELNIAEAEATSP